MGFFRYFVPLGLAIASGAGCQSPGETSASRQLAAHLENGAGPSLVPADPGGASALSPTGRAPRLLWRPSRQQAWNRMVSEGTNFWYQRLVDFCDRTGTPGQRYQDMGQYCAILYQMTGRRELGERAYAAMAPYLNPTPGDSNWHREFFMDFVWMFDWIRPVLTPAQVTLAIGTFNGWLDHFIQLDANTEDSDEVIGLYFALLFVALATGPDNPRAASFLDAPFIDSRTGEAKTMGGLDATAADRATMRNTLRQYADFARGGEWIESTAYNLGTGRLLLLGLEGVRTALGRDPFPEYAMWYREMGLAQAYSLSNDLQQAYQWGDEEHPRQLRMRHRISLLSMLMGLNAQEAGGAGLAAILHDLLERTSASGYDPMVEGRDPWARFFLFYDPAVPRAGLSSLPRSHYASGMGLLYHHDGWDAGDSFFGAHMVPRLRVDHDPDWYTTFQLYRRGAWAITHPLGYGNGTALDLSENGDGTNGMLFAGLGSMRERRGPLAQETAADGSYVYLAGESAGRRYAADAYASPPEFVHEATRSLVYLPSPAKTSDAVVIFDRTDAEDPRGLENYADGYSDDERARITGAYALKQWIFHAQTTPTLSGDVYSWSLPASQQGRLFMLLPAGATRRVVPVASLPDPNASVDAAEKTTQIRISPAAGPERFHTFLNVALVNDAGVTASATLLRSAGGEVEGVLLRRTGAAETALLFGARPQGRVLPAGFGVCLTAATASPRVLFFDLTPGRHYRVAVDGAVVADRNASSEGVLGAQISGPGVRWVQLLADGEAPAAGGCGS
jgi:hypothetical protein